VTWSTTATHSPGYAWRRRAADSPGSPTSRWRIAERIRNMLVYTNIDPNLLEKLLARKVQIRFE